MPKCESQRSDVQIRRNVEAWRQCTTGQYQLITLTTVALNNAGHIKQKYKNRVVSSRKCIEVRS